jgi:hypothetical protein
MRLVRRSRLVHSVALAVALLLSGTAGRAESAIALQGTVTDGTTAVLGGVSVGAPCGSTLTDGAGQYSFTAEQLRVEDGQGLDGLPRAPPRADRRQRPYGEIQAGAQRPVTVGEARLQEASPVEPGTRGGAVEPPPRGHWRSRRPD